jgi:hypothetical protein
MIQSLTGNIAHNKFLSASENPDQMEQEIFSVQLTDLIKCSQVVNQLKYWTSIPFKMVFKCSQLMFKQIGEVSA